jgi:hypothetical protein
MQMPQMGCNRLAQTLQTVAIIAQTDCNGMQTVQFLRKRCNQLRKRCNCTQTAAIIAQIQYDGRKSSQLRRKIHVAGISLRP